MSHTAPAPSATVPSVPSSHSSGFSHREIVTILSGLMLGMLLGALDQTVVSTAIRTIADDLNGYDLQAWATTAFLITSTIATPLYGKLSDLYGRRPLYLFAIVVFVLGSALCGVAQSMYQLAACRALQGIGAGGLMSLALTIIADIVAPRERARYQGYFMAVFGSSSVLGPVIGGFLAGQATILGISGWRWIFWVNVPLGLAAFIVVRRVMHLPHARQEHRIDWPGAIGLVTFLVPLLVVAEQGRSWGWGSGRSVTCFVVAAAGLTGLLAAELAYGDDALIPLKLFRNRTFAVSSLSSIIVGMGMFGGLLLLPQYLQVVHGSSPTKAGLQMVPLVVGIMSGSLIAGQTISRTGKYKLFPVVGVVLVTVALVSMSYVVDVSTSVWTLMPLMVMLGLGLGFNFQPVILAVQNAVNPRQMGVATSSVTTFRQLGGTLGTAAFLSILFNSIPGNTRDAVQAAIQAHPDLAQQLQKVAERGSQLSDTSFIEKLPAVLAEPFKVGFTTSLDTAFLIGGCVVALAFFVLLFLPQLPLRTASGIESQQADDARETHTRTRDVNPITGPETPGDARPKSVSTDRSSSPMRDDVGRRTV
jgi:EmrB/QacA subfamily drug resistance transporter